MGAPRVEELKPKGRRRGKVKRSFWPQGLLALALVLVGGTGRVRGAPPRPAGAVVHELRWAADVPPTPGLRVRFEGLIQSLPVTPDAPWVIAGQPVQVVAGQTAILPDGVEPAVGDRASVRAIYLQGGTLRATQIAIVKMAEYQPEWVEFSGLIAAPLPEGLVGPWMVNGIQVQVLATTQLQPAGVKPQVGDLARVQAWRQFDGQLTAATIQVESAASAATRVEFEGPIAACPAAAPFTGEWVIGDVRVRVDDPLVISGQPAPGLLAEVQALSQPDDTVVARQIRIVAPEVATVEWEGAIQALPDKGLLGTWIVGGRAVLVGTSTLVDESRAEARLGQWAAVRAALHGEGTPEALRVRVERAREDNPPLTFSGLIQGLPSVPRLGCWQVGGVAVDVGWQTRVAGPPTVGQGAMAEVTGVQRPDGRVSANRIAISYPWAPSMVYQEKIVSLPAGLFGQWRLEGGATARVSPWISIQGAPRPGAKATLRVVRLPGSEGSANSNLILALSAEVEGEAVTTQITGTVQSVPAELLGAWQVGRAMVYVDARTEFTGQPRPGSLVAVTGTQVYTATELSTDHLQILAQRIETQ